MGIVVRVQFPTDLELILACWMLLCLPRRVVVCTFLPPPGYGRRCIPLHARDPFRVTAVSRPNVPVGDGGRFPRPSHFASAGLRFLLPTHHHPFPAPLISDPFIQDRLDQVFHTRPSSSLRLPYGPVVEDLAVALAVCPTIVEGSMPCRGAA